MNVSIIIPVYMPNKEILKKVLNSIKKQKFYWKIEVIKVEKGLGLAASLNYGIKKAKHEIVVSLHQDCVPSETEWLKKLLEPLKDKDIIASVSKVHLPEELWGKLSIFARSLTLKERGAIVPLLDEKGCAYKKSVLKEVGFFNEKDFRTAGEDFDLYLRIKNKGKIAYPNCEVLHFHATSLKARLNKNYQNANGYGALVGIHGREMNRWWAGVLKATPIVGFFFTLTSYPFNKSWALFPFYIITSIPDHFLYICGFWKGFLMKRQTV